MLKDKPIPVTLLRDRIRGQRWTETRTVFLIEALPFLRQLAFFLSEEELFLL